MLKSLNPEVELDKHVLISMSHVAFSDDGKIVIAYLKKQLSLMDHGMRRSEAQQLFNLQGAALTLEKLINQLEKSLDILKKKP